MVKRLVLVGLRFLYMYMFSLVIIIIFNNTYTYLFQFINKSDFIVIIAPDMQNLDPGIVDTKEHTYLKNTS